MAPLLLLEGEAEEDGAILPTVAVNLPTSGEKDPFGISNGQSLMWEAALIDDHVSPIVAEATQELLSECFSNISTVVLFVVFKEDTITASRNHWLLVWLQTVASYC